MRKLFSFFPFFVSALLAVSAHAACGPSDLALSLDASADPAIAGTMLEYTLTVQNLDGVNSGCGVVVMIDLPNASSFVDSSGCTEDPGGENTCSLGDIGPGFNKAATLRILVDADTSGTLEASATVSATTADGDTGNNMADESTVVGFESALSVTVITDRDAAIPGDPLTYQIGVRNDGPSDAEDTELTLTLPSQVSFVSSSGCADDPNGSPLCRLQTVRAHETDVASILVEVADGATGSLVFRVDAVTSATDFDPSDDFAIVSTPMSGEQRIGEGSAPAIAADPTSSERFTVVWQGGDLPGADSSSLKVGGGGVFARVFDPAGMPVGIELRLDASGSFQRAPDVATYQDGRFVAVWQSDDADGSGIFARRFDAFGMPVGIEMQINATTDLEQSDPSVVGLDGSGFVVTWVDEESLGSFVRAARLFDAFGMPVGIEMRFGASDSSARPPAISASSERILATWQDAADRVSGQFFDTAGMPVGIEFFIAQGAASSKPALAPNDDDGFVVVWQDDSGADSDGAGIFGRLVDAFGMPVGIEFQLNTFAVGDQSRPAIAAAPDGTHAVTWQGPDAEGTGVYARRLDAFGMPVGIEQRFNVTSDGDQQRAEPAFVDANGNFYVAWQSDDAGGSDIIISPPRGFFSDGFESGNLEAWSSSSSP